MEYIQSILSLENIFKFLISHFDSIITGGITIIGFIVTYLLTRRNFRDEIIKSKREITSDIIRDLPYKICQLLNKASSGKGQISVKEFEDILSNVLSYGSKDAISIAIHMQQIAYSNKEEQSKEKSYEQLAAYSLLITQIKYDLTSEIISPESWFQLKINDYEKMRACITSKINIIVDELSLNHDFRVKEVCKSGYKFPER